MSWNAVEKGTLDMIKPPKGYVVKPGFYWEEELGIELPVVDRNAKLTHVDEWVSQPCSSKDPEAYAKFFFLLHRLHAWMQGAFRQWTSPHQLYCDFAGHTWRVTGASGMGDIWLARDFNRNSGYDLRRYVDECSNWRSEP